MSKEPIAGQPLVRLGQPWLQSQAEGGNEGKQNHGLIPVAQHRARSSHMVLTEHGVD